MFGLRFRGAWCVVLAALESSRMPAINKLSTNYNCLAQATLTIKSAEKETQHSYRDRRRHHVTGCVSRCAFGSLAVDSMTLQLDC